MKINFPKKFISELNEISANFKKTASMLNRSCTESAKSIIAFGDACKLIKAKSRKHND